MTTLPDEFDVPWKDILENYFPEFLAFFLPEAYREIDWERGFAFLDNELARITRAAEIGDRRMDKLVKVWRRGDDHELWVLIHIEIQGNRKPNFAENMYVYQYRAYDLYQKPVVGLAILADEEPGWRPAEFGYALWGTRQSYRFTAIKLLDYQEADLEKSTNPFAIVTLAHLHAKKTRHQPEKRYQVKWHLIRSLYKRGCNRKQVIDLFRFIDWVLHLPPELDNQLRSEIATFEEKQKMPYISSVERIGEKRGEAKVLTRQLQRRFGALPTWAVEKIAQADQPSLEEWSLQILDAQSLDAVFMDNVS
ncbi:MAG: DUF4351 domain-containing protein [Magnetococcales bacterium]|nr:DUF4351 domain-containing protein [Magnetococcales bacterium]